MSATFFSVSPAIHPLLLGLSVQGAGHDKRGLPCQDACRVAQVWPDLCVIAVSDGLGSAPRSDEGASVAVRAAVQFFENEWHSENPSIADLPGMLKQCFAFCRQELFKTALREIAPVSSFACTLIVVLVHGRSAIAAQVGDGAAVALRHDGAAVLTGPSGQEYANEVVPLTSNDWNESLTISPLIPDAISIAAFTDGCQRAVLRKNGEAWTANAEFLTAFFTHLRGIPSPDEVARFVQGILESPKLSAISDDDKTLAVGVL